MGVARLQIHAASLTGRSSLRAAAGGLARTTGADFVSAALNPAPTAIGRVRQHEPAGAITGLGIEAANTRRRLANSGGAAQSSAAGGLYASAIQRNAPASVRPAIQPCIRPAVRIHRAIWIVISTAYGGVVTALAPAKYERD